MDRQLTIAGALWKINRDPVFIETLRKVRAARPSLFQYFHAFKVLWLDDERALDFLIGLLDVKDAMVQFTALKILNELELGRRMPGVFARDMPHQPADYNRQRNDPAFRTRMVEAIHRRNREGKNGR
jgi:hypothetical protein